MSLEDAYKLLDVSESAGFEDILAAKRKLAKEYAGNGDRIVQARAHYASLLACAGARGWAQCAVRAHVQQLSLACVCAVTEATPKRPAAPVRAVQGLLAPASAGASIALTLEGARAGRWRPHTTSCSCKA